MLASYEPERRDHAWAMIEFALNIEGAMLALLKRVHRSWAIETAFRVLYVRAFWRATISRR